MLEQHEGVKLAVLDVVDTRKVRAAEEPPATRPPAPALTCRQQGAQPREMRRSQESGAGAGGGGDGPEGALV